MVDYPPARVVIWVRWDAESAVWFGGSDQIPGLVLEHSDFDQLVAAALDATPQLIESNCPDLKGLPIHIAADRIFASA